MNSMRILAVLLSCVGLVQAFMVPVHTGTIATRTTGSTRLSVSLLAADTHKGVKGIQSLDELMSVIQDPSESLPICIRYHATWCRACKGFEPFFLDVAQKYDGVYKFYDCDITEHRDIIKAMELKVLPHIHIYEKGEQKSSFSSSKKKVQQFVEQLDIHRSSK